MIEDIERFYAQDSKIDENGTAHLAFQTSLKKDECYALYSIVKNFKPVKTLEVGLALGASAASIISAKMRLGIKEKHVTLDPYQKIVAGNAGLLALKSLGMEAYTNHFNEFSEQYLNQMFAEKRYFDFIFIDGNHTIGQAVTDAFLADKILVKNGIIGIHDSLFFSTAASIKYLVTERKYTVVAPDKISFKNRLRQIKYFRRLGVWYCRNIIPKMHTSIVFLQKNG